MTDAITELLELKKDVESDVEEARRQSHTIRAVAFLDCIDLINIRVEHLKKIVSAQVDAAKHSDSTRRSAAQKSNAHSDANSHIGESGDSRQEKE